MLPHKPLRHAHIFRATRPSFSSTIVLIWWYHSSATLSGAPLAIAPLAITPLVIAPLVIGPLTIALRPRTKRSMTTGSWMYALLIPASYTQQACPLRILLA